MGDQRDRASGQRVRLGVADRPQAAADIDEAHAAGPAHLHPGARGNAGEAVPQRQGGGLRPSLDCVLVSAAEEHRGGVAPLGCEAELLLERGVRNSQQHQVDRIGQIGERRDASAAADLGVSRVDQLDLRCRRAPGHLVDHPLAERARPR